MNEHGVVSPVSNYRAHITLEDVWMFGKGPSLDWFPMKEAGPYRVGINETCLVRDVRVVVALDPGPVKRILHQQPKEFWKGRTLLTTAALQRINVPDGVPHLAIDHRDMVPRPKATAAFALQALYHLGVGIHTLHMVGFDGWGLEEQVVNGVYSDEVCQKVYQDRPSKSKTGSLKTINKSIGAALSAIGLADERVIWEHRNPR